MAVEKIKGRVEYKQKLSPKVYLVRIHLKRKTEFLPGQYTSLKVTPEGMRRSYSVASLPGKETIDLLVDISPMGVGSKYILSLKPGDEVEVMAFLGAFTIEMEPLLEAKQILMVATGTGIAPIKPMVEDLLYNKHFPGEVRVVWGMRYEEDLYWLKEFDNINRDFDNFKFDVTLSKPKEDWPGFRGHTDVVIETLKQDWSKTLVYLCGSPEMIHQTEKRMKELGVPEKWIYYEKYF